MDVSGSMYRFNSRDKRLERMLEAALLVRVTGLSIYMCGSVLVLFFRREGKGMKETCCVVIEIV